MKAFHLSAILIFYQSWSTLSSPLPEDANLYFTELATKYGHPPREYNVVTEDGYILSLHNLPGRKKIPVLFMHGIQSTADIWILRGNGSLPITLANAGYDVWLGNYRGNRYSRSHIHLDPDKNPSYWDFSFHEVAIYDLTAIIDTILKKTAANKVNAIGHSLGNTIFYVLGSTRPEYNEKVNVLIALAPICYLNDIPPPLSTIFKLTPFMGAITKQLNMHELFGGFVSKLLTNICLLPVVGYKICADHIIFPLFGYDPDEFDGDFYKIAMTHFPSSSSIKNFIHVAQLYNRETFAQYDYGLRGNRALYNMSVPPEYPLSEVTMPVALIAARNDKTSLIKNVKKLSKQLPNIVRFVVAEREQFNHIDHLMGERMDSYLFPYVFEILDQYN